MKTDHNFNSWAAGIGPLSGMEKNPLLTPVHISLYAALLHLGQIQNSNPFNVNRRSLMGLSRIRSTATYHRCIKRLVDSGYIFYEPSYHPAKGSKVFLIGKHEKTTAFSVDRKMLFDLFVRGDKKRRWLLFSLYGALICSPLSACYLAEMISKDLGQKELVNAEDIKVCRFYFKEKSSV